MLIKRIAKYISKHHNTITDSIFFLVVIAAAFPFYNLFVGMLTNFAILLTNVIEKGMSDTFQLLFISIFLYLTIKIFELIISAASYMQEQTKKISNDLNRPRKKKN